MAIAPQLHILHGSGGAYTLIPSQEVSEDRTANGVAPEAGGDVTQAFEASLSKARSESSARTPIGSRQVEMRSIPDDFQGVIARHKEVTYPTVGHAFLESGLVQACTLCLILGNAIVIGLETDCPNLVSWDIVENLFLIFFTVELTLRLGIIGCRGFFSCSGNPDFVWNVFDFFIVTLGIVNSLADAFVGKDRHFGKDATLFRIVRLLRLMRVLRIIRIVRFLKQLYLLAYGFVEGTMAVFWVTLLASFMLYVCSVILVRTYGHGHYEDDMEEEFFTNHFGSIPRTMFSLFELISAPDLRAYKRIMFMNPPMSLFLITFIILGSFGINGLLVALINESILEKNQARIEADRIEREYKRKMMQQQCRDLFDTLDVHKNRVLPRDELMKCKGSIAKLFEVAGVNFEIADLDQMFYIMDHDDTGSIERSEFVQGVVELCDQIRPMSIMELNYQVAKCLSKVEVCNNKVEILGKTVEHCDTKLDNLTRSLDFYGRRHSKETAEIHNMVQHLVGVKIDQPMSEDDAKARGNARHRTMGGPSPQSDGLRDSLKSLAKSMTAPLGGGKRAAYLASSLDHGGAGGSPSVQSLPPAGPPSPLQSLISKHERLLSEASLHVNKMLASNGSPSQSAVLGLVEVMTRLQRANADLVEASCHQVSRAGDTQDSPKWLA